ncbi:MULTISPECIES: helix-turn-helix transcriptional regulator [Aeromonas]|uniref:helix-turn-helix transcriptional regulator n=1 Tax=Aeromonas TaxID=642 RepID=UPI00100C3631
MTNQSQTLITIASTCEMLNISRPTIYRWMKDESLQFPSAIKIGPNSIRFRHCDVMDFISRRACR